MPVTINGSAGVVTNTGAVYDGLQRATEVTASGTSIDFTGIPSWVERITVILNGVSTNGTSSLQVQLGTSSGIVTSGYASGFIQIANNVTTPNTVTSGFAFYNIDATSIHNAIIPIINISGNVWVTSFAAEMTNGRGSIAGGNISLASTLDRIRITTVSGTDTFDAGTINIIYE